MPEGAVYTLEFWLYLLGALLGIAAVSFAIYYWWLVRNVKRFDDVEADVISLDDHRKLDVINDPPSSTT